MSGGFPLWPPVASEGAARVDHLYIALLVVCGAMAAFVFLGLLWFSIRYRKGSGASRAGRLNGSYKIEFGWTFATLIAFMVMFFFGVRIYFDDFRPPADAMDVYVVGKQWMWKVEHPGRQREIDTLHVPVGQSVRLTITSDDVIHDFFIPAFRIKRDAVPGMYTQMWFRPTKPGKYHLFCSQYCGTQHAGMIGSVFVMTPSDYQQWLSGGPAPQSMAQSGAELFRKYGCDGCHMQTKRCPSLEGLPGSLVHLNNGQTIVADDNYIRQSIVAPASQIVAGYPDIMPSFQGQISESQILDLIAFIKSLGGAPPAGGSGVPASSRQASGHPARTLVATRLGPRRAGSPASGGLEARTPIRSTP